MNGTNFIGKMKDFLPPCEIGNWRVDYITLSPQQVEREKMRGMFSFSYSEVYDLVPGTFTRLMNKNNDIMMSDTPMELRTQSAEVSRATGDCLVGGLGLGIFILQIQNKPEVTSILVIEKEKDIIDLIKPRLPFNTKVTIVHGDVFDKMVVDRKRKFDFIFMDIWLNISGDNASEVGILKRRWRPLLRKDNPNAWIGAWRERDFIRKRREDR